MFSCQSDISISKCKGKFRFICREVENHACALVRQVLLRVVRTVDPVIPVHCFKVLQFVSVENGSVVYEFSVVNLEFLRVHAH